MGGTHCLTSPNEMSWLPQLEMQKSPAFCVGLTGSCRLELFVFESGKDVKQTSRTPNWEGSGVFVFLIFYWILGFGVHEQSMQDSCVDTHMAVCFAFLLPFTHIWHFSPGYPSPPPPPTGPPLFPPIDPSV